MKTINVLVRDKIASVVGDIVYICGNSDYVINFDFDAEWDDYDVKTARFVHDGSYIDVVFTGNQCAMPVIHKAYGIYVGVYAGDLRTTTPAHIPSAASILSAEGTPDEPPDDVYAQITALCNKAVAEATSVRKDADAGKFDGAPGKSAYQYAQDGGYTGTEAEFAEKLASGDNFYIDLAGPYPDYTCPMTMDDIKAAYDAGYNLVCRCTLGAYTAALPLAVPMPNANFWAFSVFGSMSLSVVITEGRVSAQLTEVATIYDRLPNPQSLTFTGAAEGTYDGSEPLTVEIPSGDSIVPAPSSADNGKYLGCADGKAAWLPVEASGGGGDISLGLTAASVGQTIKVKAVDENGKPTEWEAADLINCGDKWELLNSIEISETVNTITISADKDGNPLTLKRAVVVCELNRDMDDPFTYIKMKANGLTVCSNQQANNTTQKVYFCYFFEIVPGFGIFVDTLLSYSNYNWIFSRQKIGYKYNDDYKQKSINSIKLEANDGNKNVCASGKIDVFGVRA